MSFIEPFKGVYVSRKPTRTVSIPPDSAPTGRRKSPQTVSLPPRGAFDTDEGDRASIMGVKFADSHTMAMLLSYEQRKKSGLPFVSWEQSLSYEDELLAEGVSYPRTAAEGQLDTISDFNVRSQVLKGNIQRLTKSDLPKAIGVTKSNFKDFFPNPKTVTVANESLATPFFAWNVEEAVLLPAAKIGIRPSIRDAICHLVKPSSPRVRFTQCGEGLVGVHPRIAAWRSWLDFQNGNSEKHDYLMGLLHFAWLTLQVDLRYSRYVLGGTVVKEHDEMRVLLAQRVNDGWFVDVWRDDPGSCAAILLMS